MKQKQEKITSFFGQLNDKEEARSSPRSPNIKLTIKTFRNIYLSLVFSGIVYRDFKLRLEGHFGDKLLNILIDAVTTIFRKEILIVIEVVAEKEIEKMLQDINIAIPHEFQTRVRKVTLGREFDDYMPYKIDY